MPGRIPVTSLGRSELQSMKVQCPRCTATIHLENPQDAPQIIKCWMCKATIEAPMRDPGPKTIRTSSNSRENPDPVALGINQTTAAASMELPVAERIRLQLVTGS